VHSACKVLRFCRSPGCDDDRFDHVAQVWVPRVPLPVEDDLVKKPALLLVASVAVLCLTVTWAVRRKRILEGEHAGPVIRRKSDAAARHLVQKATHVAVLLTLDAATVRCAAPVAPFVAWRAAVAAVVAAIPTTVEEERSHVTPAKTVYALLHSGRWLEYNGSQIVPVVAARAKAPKQFRMAHVDQSGAHAIHVLPRVHAPDVAQRVRRIRRTPSSYSDTIAVEGVYKNARGGQVSCCIGEAPPSVEFRGSGARWAGWHGRWKTRRRAWRLLWWRLRRWQW